MVGVAVEGIHCDADSVQSHPPIAKTIFSFLDLCSFFLTWYLFVIIRNQRQVTQFAYLIELALHTLSDSNATNDEIYSNTRRFYVSQAMHLLFHRRFRRNLSSLNEIKFFSQQKHEFNFLAKHYCRQLLAVAILD